MISANGGLPAHRYTPQVTQRWPQGSEPASKGIPLGGALCRCEGRLRSGAPPPPAACPLGGLSGSATNVL